jgi:hypothetical protein
MERVENAELRGKILAALASKYKLKDIRENNHLSSFVYCLTKGFFEQTQPIEPTEKELMLFSVGYGLQDILTPADATAPLIEKDGIMYRPDFVLSQRLSEVKSTRKSANKHYTDDIPLSWVKYMLGGMKMTGKREYDLAVIYIIQADVRCDTFYASDNEVEDNWTEIIIRKAVADTALADNTPPEPFQWCMQWECAYCRYKMVCSMIVGTNTETTFEEITND